MTIKPLGPGGELTLEPEAGGGGRASTPPPKRRRQLRLSDRKLVATLVVAMFGVAAAAGGYLISRDSRSSNTVQGLPAGHPTVTAVDGTDLDGVSNDELEGVVEAHPDVVGMRLALVERYLDAAAKETSDEGRKTQLQKAAFHALEAERRATDPADHARAVADLGWADAHLGDPTTGVGLLEQSLQEQPGNPNALWYLAVVQFRVLGQPAAAADTLNQLIASPSATDAQRQRAQVELSQAQAVA